MKQTIRVCAGRKCTERGSVGIMQRLEEYFGLSAGDNNDRADLDFCQCTGYCEQGPNVVIGTDQIIYEAKCSSVAEKIEAGETVKMTEPNLEEIIKNDFLGNL